MHKILFLGLIGLSNALFAMSSDEIIVVTLGDLAKKEQQHRYYYPDVRAAQDKGWGCAIADVYFTVQLPKTKIANMIPFTDACKYWSKGGNLPEAGRVIPSLKEYTQEVMRRAFALRKTILQGFYIDQELFAASNEINETICADSEQLKKWKELQPLIAAFSKEYVEKRNGYLGHDV